MGQIEILQYLAQARVKNDHSFKNINEIKTAVNQDHLTSTYNQVNQLIKWGYLETKYKNQYHTRAIFVRLKQNKIKTFCNINKNEH